MGTAIPTITVPISKPLVNWQVSGHRGDIFVIAVDVSTTDTTVGKTTGAFFGSNAPAWPLSNRRVSVSQCPGDFSASARLMVPSDNDWSIQLTTEPARASGKVALITPGRWYVNILWEDCRDDGFDRADCKLDIYYAGPR